MTLRNLFDELNEWANSESIRSLRSPEKQPLVAEMLEELGGKIIGRGCYSIAAKFVCHGRAFVVKVSYYDEVNLLSRATIESNQILGQRYLRPLFSSQFVAVQEYMRPLNYHRARRAAEMIRPALRKHGTGTDYDVHSENIGFCPRRRMVMIFDAQNW